jgi:Rrf2 family transcriptional regulator, iron-sulfur cluster assembly transcription factor
VEISGIGRETMIYSNACAYAIRALSRLAGSDASGYVKLRDIAEAEEIPYPFLANTFRTLVAGGVVTAARGPGGGYALVEPADRVTLHEIKRIIDGVSDLDACAVGLAACSDEAPCPLHETWKPIRGRIAEYLERTTLADMATALEKKRGDMA